MEFKKGRRSKFSSTQSSVKLALFASFVFVFLIWTLLHTGVHRDSVQFFNPDHFTAESPLKSGIENLDYLVNTEGCRIPMMDPFDPSIIQYVLAREKKGVGEERPIICPPPGKRENRIRFIGPLVTSNLTHLIMDKAVISSLNSTSLECCYEPFWRKAFNNSSIDGNKPKNTDTQFEVEGVCYIFDGSAVDMEGIEFVKVECYENDNSSEIIYKDFFSFAPEKIRKSSFVKNNRSVEEKWNLLVLGADAVSRMNLYRQMPKTLDFIKRDLKGIEMLGYNKVDDNTFPNLVPVLSGLSVEELKNNCWPKEDAYFDDCPFVWKDFRKKGYRTLFAEDSSWMGIFNYVKSGFYSQPTDYYWRTFDERAEKEIGTDKRLNSYLCAGFRTFLQNLLDYGKKFVSRTKDKGFFGLIWGSSITHDFLNLPRYADEDYARFLKDLNEIGVFQDSVLVFMSDHGIRWGGIRSTYQGHLEERLPFLFFVIPERFRQLYPTAVGYLKSNARKLTTPFDVHETLLDILRSKRHLQNDALKQRIRPEKFYLSKNGDIKRGISLFLPVPKNRTCEDAGITDHWCTCHQTVKISIYDTQVRKAARYLVDFINNLLMAELSRCTLLYLNRIILARVEQPLADFYKDNLAWLRDYIITVEVNPSGAIFEATVRKNLNGTFKITGTISRTNVYGNQSACVDNYRLRLYCYCLKQNINQ